MNKCLWYGVTVLCSVNAPVTVLCSVNAPVTVLCSVNAPVIVLCSVNALFTVLCSVNARVKIVLLLGTLIWLYRVFKQRVLFSNLTNLSKIILFPSSHILSHE
jgi:hypothetical protein